MMATGIYAVLDDLIAVARLPLLGWGWIQTEVRSGSQCNRYVAIGVLVIADMSLTNEMGGGSKHYPPALLLVLSFRVNEAQRT